MYFKAFLIELIKSIKENYHLSIHISTLLNAFIDVASQFLQFALCVRALSQISQLVEDY